MIQSSILAISEFTINLPAFPPPLIDFPVTTGKLTQRFFDLAKFSLDFSLLLSESISRIGAVSLLLPVSILLVSVSVGSVFVFSEVVKSGVSELVVSEKKYNVLYEMKKIW